MNEHLTDEQLVQHYFGDDIDRPTVVSHLGGCDSCRALFARLSETLAAIKRVDAPEPLHGFEDRIWHKVHEGIVSVQRPYRLFFPLRQWVYALGIAAALILAFTIGRFSPRTEPPTVVANSPEVARERILLVTVADHLERSQLMLLEFVNATDADSSILSRERERAADLVADNRLFRQAASREGDHATVAVLAELERVLLEIENAPDSQDGGELASLRDVIKDKGLLLKVRVVGLNARERLVRPRRDTLAGTI